MISCRAVFAQPEYIHSQRVLVPYSQGRKVKLHSLTLYAEKTRVKGTKKLTGKPQE